MLFKADYDWYLANQIHPPLARLCDPIDETDSKRIADCLGLDVKKYALQQRDEEPSVFTLDQLNPEERFKNVSKKTLECRECAESFEFAASCPKCSTAISTGQIVSTVRAEIAAFNTASLVCEACGPTVQKSVKVSKCSGCDGLLRLQVCLELYS